MLGWGSEAHAAEPCDVNADVVAAYGRLLAHDVDGVRAGLEAAESHLACGAPVGAQTLARLWLVEGALFAETGEDDPAPSFAAAKRLDALLWLPDLSEAARASWQASPAEAGTGTLSFDVAPGGREVRVDGAPWSGGPVGSGLHGVQVLGADGAAVWGAVAYVGDGTETTLATGLPPAVAEPARPPRPERPRRGGAAVPLAITALTGAALSLGSAIRYDDGTTALDEPATKLVLPALVGLRLDPGPTWLRGEVGVGALVGGQYLGRSRDGELRHGALQTRLALAGGLAIGPWRPGVSTGVAWPGRLSERLVLGRQLRGPLGLEARAGADLASERALEPAVELLVSVALGD